MMIMTVLTVLSLPLLLWLLLPDQWQGATPWIVLATIVLLVVMWARQVAQDAWRQWINPARPDCHWRGGVGARQFCTRLTIFLRDRGWRVDAEIPDAGRVQVTIEKDRRIARLLCVAPGSDIRPADIGAVLAWREGPGARGVAIVSDHRRPDPASLSPKEAEIFFLRYEEIDDLDMLFWTGG
jgi:hypothetical protein